MDYMVSVAGKLAIVGSTLARFLVRPQSVFEPERQSAILHLEEEIWRLVQTEPVDNAQILYLFERWLDTADTFDASSASTADISSPRRITRTPSGNKRKIGDEEKDLKDNARESAFIEYLIREASVLRKGDLLDDIANSRREVDGHEESLFFHLVRLSRDQVATYLLDKCRIDLETQNGLERRTALYEAVAARKKGLMLSILNSQFVSPSKYINISDINGNTALHHMVTLTDEDEATGDATVAELLTGILDHGPDIDATNYFGCTPIQWLIVQRDETTKSIADLETLCKAGAELNTKDVYGTCGISIAQKVFHKRWRGRHYHTYIHQTYICIYFL